MSGRCNAAEVVQRQPLDGKERLVGDRLILVSIGEVNGKGPPNQFVKVLDAPPNIAFQLVTHACTHRLKCGTESNKR